MAREILEKKLYSTTIYFTRRLYEIHVSSLTSSYHKSLDFQYTETSLGPRQVPMMRISCKSSLKLKTVNYFRTTAPF